MSKDSGVVFGAGKRLPAVAVVYRTQDADGIPRGPEDRFDQVGDGGLAVGSHDADEADPGGGITEEVLPQDAEGAPAVADADGPHPGGGVKLPLMDDKTCATGNGVGDEVMAVRLQARDRHEETPLAAEPGIVTDRRNLAIRLLGGSQRIDSSHQERKVHRNLS